MPKKIIGRIDKVDFPALDLFDIKIKIDTGAYTSSIHCHNYYEENGILTCLFYHKDYPNSKGKTLRFKNFTTTKVKSSNGISQTRYKIKTTVFLFNKTYQISLTLNDRDDMKYPILIGRKFLLKKCIVDVALKDVSYKEKMLQINNTSSN